MSDLIAIMGQGCVQQFGPPDKIAEGPKNRFVASCIGDKNFLDGKVIAANGDQATIRTALATDVTTTHRCISGTGPATMSIRPEKIDLAQTIKLAKIASVDEQGGSVNDVSRNSTKRAAGLFPPSSKAPACLIAASRSTGSIAARSTTPNAPPRGRGLESLPAGNAHSMRLRGLYGIIGTHPKPTRRDLAVIAQIMRCLSCPPIFTPNRPSARKWPRRIFSILHASVLAQKSARVLCRSARALRK